MERDLICLKLDPIFWIEPRGFWIWKNVLKLKLKDLKIERIGLKPSLQEPLNKFSNVKIETEVLFKGRPHKTGLNV